VKADQFCAGGVAYDKADYWTEATTFPKASYGQCGSEYYVQATHFCSVYNTVVEKCGDTGYDPANQYCESDVVVNNYEICGTALYDTHTQVCDDTDPTDPVVVAKD
jgi:hypothetical protein